MEKRKKEVLVLEDILGSNKKLAASIRQKLRENGILAVNLLSSPGSGKTSLLEKSACAFKDRFRIGVIEGEHRNRKGCRENTEDRTAAWQITTHGACHLEAK